MRLFLDTASIEEIREINRWGVLRGVTTNPTLVGKEKADPDQTWKEILTEVHGDISLETTEPEADAMYRQGLELAAKGDNVVVKVPMTPAGLETGKRLTDEGIRINVTLVFSPARPSWPRRSGRTSCPPSSDASTTRRPTGCTPRGRSAIS